MSVAIGDVNGDGTPDVVATLDNRVQIFVALGDGSGHFGPGQSNPAGGFFAPSFGTVEVVYASSWPSAVMLVDLDEDGRLDLVADEDLDVTSLFRNTTAAIPMVELAVPTVARGGALALGDFDGDGRPDLVAADGGLLSVSLGTGGGFVWRDDLDSVSVSTALPSPPGHAADFDEDGAPDLLVPAEEGTAVFLNDGTGDFGGPTFLGSGAEAPAIGDVDGDGHLDLRLDSIWRGDGHGGFTQLGSLPGGVGSKALGDLDGDLDLDLVGDGAVFLNDGSGVFGPASAYTGCGSAALTDLDGDGDLDAASADGNGSICSALGDGAGGFAPPVSFNVTNGVVSQSEPSAGAVGDLNGDGIPDIAIPIPDSVDIYVALGDGSGSFGPGHPRGSGRGFEPPGFGPVAIAYAVTWPTAVLLADVDGDGRTDIVAREANSTSVFLNDSHRVASDPGVDLSACGIGACRRTVDVCVAGEAQTCTPGPPDEEICNGVDDDCDNAVDEAIAPLECGVGACATTVAKCLRGVPQECAPLSPGIESCNLSDDDCNGVVDDVVCTAVDQCHLAGVCDPQLGACTSPPAPDGQACNDGNACTQADACDTGACVGADPLVCAPVGSCPTAGVCDPATGACSSPCPTKASDDVRISDLPFSSGQPSLAWSGTEYGVSWYDHRDGVRELYFARISAAGAQIGADVRVTSGGGDSPSLVWADGEYGLAWRGNGNQIYFARLTFEGVKIGGDVAVSSGGNAFQRTPDLVWTGSEYGVIWHDARNDGGSNREIYIARISAAGVKQGADVRVTTSAGSSVNPSIAWNGTEYGVTWGDDRNGNFEIYFTRLSSTGVKVGGDIRVTTAPSTSNFPWLVWTGSEYGVSWQDARTGNFDIFFARLSTTGDKVGADVNLTQDAVSSEVSSLAWIGTEYGVTWYDQHEGNFEIYFARLSPAGEIVGGALRVTNALGTSALPVLAWSGDRYGVSWDDTRDGSVEIYFSVVDVDPD